MIELINCKDRSIYTLNSRNLVLGVFREETKGFIGIRYKFGNRYLFEEYHWDTGVPYGTAKPLKLLELLPADIDLLTNYIQCDDCKTIYKEEYKKDKCGCGTQKNHLMADNDRLFNYLKRRQLELGLREE